MPDPRQHVRPGQKLQIAAQQINFLNGLMRKGGGFGSGGLTGWSAGTNVIMARNDTGAALGRFGIMEIDGIVINPADGDSHLSQHSEMPCVIGVAPQVPAPAGLPVSRVMKLCISLEPIPQGKIGRVVVSGPVPVQLSAGIFPEQFKFARAIHNSTGYLEPCMESDAPAKILWRNEFFGLGLVVLNECGQRFLFGKTPDVPWLPNERLGIELYDNGPNEDPAGGFVQARNGMHPVAPNSWVRIWNAPDGDWWLMAASKWDYSCSPCVVAGHDLAQLPGYDPNLTQILGHEDGCLKWISTTECPPG